MKIFETIELLISIHAAIKTALSAQVINIILRWPAITVPRRKSLERKSLIGLDRCKVVRQKLKLLIKSTFACQFQMPLTHQIMVQKKISYWSFFKQTHHMTRLDSQKEERNETGALCNEKIVNFFRGLWCK